MSIVCLVSSEVEQRVVESLGEHYLGAGVEVIVDRRRGDRRARTDRRQKDGGPPKGREERRLVHNQPDRGGRRIAERRAALLPVDSPLPLPRRAAAHAEAARIAFYDRVELSEETIEDADTARLVVRIQCGERDLFARLYRRYFDRIYGYLIVMLGNERDAEDAAQQAFTNAIGALDRYERRRQPFRAWLFRIAHNCALDQLRRHGRFEPTDPETLHEWRENGGEETPVTTLGWIADHELLLFIERLPLAQRQVLLLRYKGDLTDVQIAEVLGRKPADVRMLQARALRFLRERLTAVGRRDRGGCGIRMRRWGREAPVLRGRRWALHG